MVEIILFTLLYGLIYPARPEGAEALSPGQRPGYKAISNAPCKGKSFKIHLIKIENPLRYVKLLPLQGVSCISLIPRALPWAKSFCPFRAYCWVFLAFWALLLWASWPFGRAAGSSWPFGRCCCGLLDHQGVLLGLLGLLGVAVVGFLAFWACCCELLGLRLYLKPANFKRIIQKKERK